MTGLWSPKQQEKTNIRLTSHGRLIAQVHYQAYFPVNKLPVRQLVRNSHRAD